MIDAPPAATATTVTDGPTADALPFWLVNVPRAERPSSCPEFLRDANAKDREILSTPDEDYHLLTWPEVRDLVERNRIDIFQRKPSDLRRYHEYIWHLKRQHGSVIDFVLQNRLQWTDLTPKDPTPFADPEDLKILRNDWPYGIDPAIVHIVVWVKFELEEDPALDDLTPRTRAVIDDYVRRVFCTHVKSENVVWFKNWRSLKSVHAVEHFHVMLYEPDPAFVKRVTGGDVAMSDKV